MAYDTKWLIDLSSGAAITADGNYPSATGVTAYSGTAVLHVEGTFGSGTATFQVSVDGTNWTPLANASFTSNGSIGVVLGAGQRVRCVVSGSSGASLRAYLSYVEVVRS